MRLIDRYIATTIGYVTLLVMIVLLSLFSFSSMVNELSDVGEGSYTIWKAMQYVLLSMPRLAYQLFPTVALLGSLIALGVLASNNELIVLRAAGVSLGRIVVSVMKVGIVIALTAIVLGEVIAPKAERYAQNMRSEALNENKGIAAKEGFWARDGANFIHVGEVYADGSLGHISIYGMDKNLQLTELTLAKQAKYQNKAWHLETIQRSEIAQTGVTTSQLDSETRGRLLNPDMLDIIEIEPEFLTTLGLYHYIEFLHDNSLDAARYEQAFWKKVISPLATAVMVFLAVPFIFGPLRSVPISQRVLVGTFVGIGFHLSNEILGFIGLLYRLDMFWSSIMPTLVFFSVGLILMQRAIR